MNEEKESTKKVDPRMAYKARHLEKGLCPACASKAAVKVILQDNIQVFKKRMIFCWKHHQSRNKSIKQTME